jgi:LPS-assembly lipoprotein
LPADLGPVRVTSTTQYSPLAEAVAVGLRHAGAVPADADAKDVASLEILSERWGDLPIALDAQGRAQEFSLRYAAVFVFRRADGSELVPQQVVELSRDYVSPPQSATGTATEREILANELRREMAASILRRIDGVIQGGAQGQKPAP